MSTNTQFLNADAYGSTFVDPLNPNFSVRFKTARNRKSLNGLTVDNFITEIIVSDVNQITVGTTTANDTLAVRIRTSGSEFSQARLKAILLSVASQISDWNGENVLLGFRPVTLPINP